MILTEASCGLTSGYILKAIKDAGYICVASDIRQDCFAKYLADAFIAMPPINTTDYWQLIEKILIDQEVDVVIPSLDETLFEWAARKDYFSSLGVHVIVSEKETIKICQDKWLTYRFFLEHGIPTPKSSLKQLYGLVKPRLGRGAKGVKITTDRVDMKGMISQEFITGIEYTVDVFCDKDSQPIYIVPRRRINVINGKSTEGIVENNPAIDRWIIEICKKINFKGPINIQCFVQQDESVIFIEINPRIAGGMALGFAATDNWIKLAVENIINGQEIIKKDIRYRMEMKRYYAEIFISPG